MRHLAVAHRTAVAIETDVGDVMLAARVEAATHLDAQVLYGRVHRKKFPRETIANLARQPARRSDAEFARVGAGARHDVEDCAGAVFAETDLLQFPIQRRQVRLADPSQDDVLFYG